MSNSTYHIPAKTYEEFQKKLNKMIENEDAATICGNIEWQRLGKTEYCYSGKYGDFVYDRTKFVPIYDEDEMEIVRSEMDDGSLDFPDNSFDFIEQFQDYICNEPAFNKYICEWELLEGCKIPNGFNIKYVEDVNGYESNKKIEHSDKKEVSMNEIIAKADELIQIDKIVDSKSYIYDI